MVSPKSVLVTQFEPDGDSPGELTLFKDRLELEPLALADCGELPVYANQDQSVLAVVAGVGTANTAVSITALGMSNAVDVSDSRWVVCGIAGGNPHQCALGSVVVSDYCVDGDLAFEIDARELPQQWSTGILPLGAREPFGSAVAPDGYFGRPYQVFQLNERNVESVLRVAQAIPLADHADICKARAGYTLYPEARQAPFVIQGTTLSGARFWHGCYANAWAERWVEHWTAGNSVFVASSMEDSGTLHALQFLSSIGRASFDRVTLIRGISNFTLPVDSAAKVETLFSDLAAQNDYAATSLALENSFRVVNKIL